MASNEPRRIFARRDFVALGIAAAAVIMFVGIGGTVLPQIYRALSGRGSGPDLLLTNALLLNIALVIFGWRRHRMLAQEVDERRKAEAHAWILAETDPLTGCLNRRSIGQATDRLVSNLLLPLAGLAVAVFFGWVVPRDQAAALAELKQGLLSRTLIWILRYPAPGFILGLMLYRLLAP